MASIRGHASLTTSLVSYWPLQEQSGTRYDAHSTNDLTDNNTVLYSASGEIGNAADFEKANTEYLSRTDNAALSITGAFSMSFWIKIESSTAQDVVVSKWNETSNQRSYAVDIVSGGGPLRFIISSNGTATTQVVGGTSLSTATWYHVVITYNPSTRMEIFINGVTDGNNTTSIPASMFDSTAEFRLGSSPNFASAVQYFDGLIDEVGVWNKVLSGAEITDLYNSGNGLKYAALRDDLVSWWPLDETSGTRNDAHSTNHLTDNNTVLYATGKQSNAADFESANTEYLSILDASQSGLDITGDIAISAWVQIESAPASGTARSIMGKWAASNGAYALLYQNNAGTNQIVLQQFDNSSGSANIGFRVNYTFSTATWYYVTVTYRCASNTMYAYVNGALVGSTTGEGTVDVRFSGTGTFQIGNYTLNTDYVWDGLIDEACIYSRAITLHEVEQLYASGSGLNYAGTADGGGVTIIPSLATLGVGA